MSRVEYMDGVDSDDNTVSNVGSRFQIGDGVWVTAAQLIMEFNEEEDLADRMVEVLDIVDNSTLLDLRGYRTQYESEIADTSEYPDGDLPNHNGTILSQRESKAFR